MVSGVNAEFCGLKPSDHLGDYANAFEIGRQLAQPGGMQPASLTPGATIPTRSYDPVATAGLLSDRRVQQTGGAPRPEGDAPDIRSRIAALDVAQRAGVARQAEKIAGALRAIQASTADLNERLRIARHMAPAAGIDPARIVIGDVTDHGIAAHVAQAMNLKAQLEPGHGKHWRDLAKAAASRLPDIALRQEFADQ